MTSLGPSADRVSSSPQRVELDEEGLVRRAQLGSASAFERLVLARGPHLYRYLAVRLQHDGDALEALQETLTAAWQGLPSLKDASKFWPWLVGIGAHKASDVTRERIRASDRTLEMPGGGEGDMFEIREAVAALPEHFRQVILLRYLVGLSEEEVAEALGIRVGTVKSRSARARKALMEVLR